MLLQHIVHYLLKDIYLQARQVIRSGGPFTPKFKARSHTAIAMTCDIAKLWVTKPFLQLRLRYHNVNRKC